MTNFVLQGGVTSKESPENEEFFKLFTALPEKSEVRILMCYWATIPERWDEKFKRDVKAAEKQATKKVSFTLLETTEDLQAQMKDYDVLYVAGGDSENIEPYYSKLGNLKDLLEGKVFIGSSMGAFMVASNYVMSYDSQETSTVHKGLGILPINILCHWDVEKEKERKINMLKDTSPDIPILTLDECKFATFVL